MKKAVNFIIIIFFLVIPINVKAFSKINKIQIQGMEDVTIGDTLSLSFYVGVSELQKNKMDSLGIAGILFELDFDDTIFNITSISKLDSFQTQIYQEDGKYFVLSYIDESNSFKNKCADGVLYCADYLQTIHFYLKDTEKEKTEIKMSDINVLLFPVGSNYEDDELTILEDGETSIIMNIKKSDTTIEKEEQESIVTTQPVIDIASNIKNKVNEVKNDNSNENDSNTYLKSIEIKNYEIKFNKNKLEYYIDLDKDINNLEITAQAESSTSKIEISGNDDLKSNDFKVTITVTSQSGSKRVYIIKTKNDTLETEDKNNAKSASKKNLISKININNINKKIILYSGIGIAVIIIIISIIVHKKNKDFSKKIDEML